MGESTGGTQNILAPNSPMLNAAALGAAPFTGGASLLAPPAIGALNGGMNNGLEGAAGGAMMGAGPSFGGMGFDPMMGGIPNAASAMPNLMGMINPSQQAPNPVMQSGAMPQMAMNNGAADQFFNSPNGQNFNYPMY